MNQRPVSVRIIVETPVVYGKTNHALVYPVRKSYYAVSPNISKINQPAQTDRYSILLYNPNFTNHRHRGCHVGIYANDIERVV